MSKANVNKSTSITNYIVVIGIIILFGLIALMFFTNKNNLNDNRIKEISYSEYTEKLKSKGYEIFLLASPDCRFCVKYKPFMNQVAVDYDLEVNYIDVSSKDLQLEEYVSLHDGYSVLKEKYDDGNPIIPTPTTIIVKNGKEVISKSGNLGYEGFLKLLKESGVLDGRI